MLIQQDHVGGCRYGLQDQFPLALLLLRLGERLGILQFGYDQELELRIMTQPTDIIGDEDVQFAAGGLSYDKQIEFHSTARIKIVCKSTTFSRHMQD